MSGNVINMNGADLSAVIASDETLDVPIAGFTFTLRRDVGWYQEEGTQFAALRMYLGEQAINSGTVRSAGELSYRMDPAGRDLSRIEARLVNWSLPIPLNRDNIRRLRQVVKTALLAEIAKLEEQEGVPDAVKP